MKAAIVPAAKSDWEIKEVPTPEPGANLVGAALVTGARRLIAQSMV